MTPFQLNDELLALIRSDIEQQNKSALKKRTQEYHYADLAEIIDELSVEEGVYLIKLLDSENFRCPNSKLMRISVKKY